MPSRPAELTRRRDAATDRAPADDCEEVDANPEAPTALWLSGHELDLLLAWALGGSVDSAEELALRDRLARARETGWLALHA